ncbi:hypothetical protein [Nitrosopumilus sp.]|uniref:hypothetical protein n=1 Tax=Nitrosopumilus sp. TaxID=2024843 RepID=UPI00247D8DC4|nr:hypothetical protein [Nitrosopumilus sp.]MCV0409937.1 hypothetical protein [Nitrosopumilus sp.]
MSALPKKEPRPTGITVFAILYGIGLAGSILLIFFFSAIPFLGNSGSLGMLTPFLVPIFIITGIINGVMMYALLSRKSWGRTLIRALAIINIILDLLHLNVIGIIINAVILWYMGQSHVKAYFNVDS